MIPKVQYYFCVYSLFRSKACIREEVDLSTGDLYNDILLQL